MSWLRKASRLAGWQCLKLHLRHYPQVGGVLGENLVHYSAFAELFAQRERLMLIRRSDVRPVNFIWPTQQRHVVESPDKLPVLD